MIAWHFKRCRAGLVLVVLASLTVLPACGGAYLPLVGPPPLRFEMAMRHVKAISWTPPVPTPPVIAAQTNPPPVISTTPANNVAALPATLAPASAPAPVLPAPVPPENLFTKSAPQNPSANNLLTVTPEMLVDYFKPNNAMTNSSNIRVLAPVNFTPPPSVSIPSSQAIYNSQ